MNKAELVNAVAKVCGCSKVDAAGCMEAMLDAVTKSLKKGEAVTLVGFGTFSVRKRAARTGRNPQTGKEIKIPAKKVAAFKPGKELKAAVK